VRRHAPPGPDEPELIEHRWPEPVHDPSDLADGVLGPTLGGGKHFAGGHSVDVEQVARSLDLHGDPRQRRPEAVVEVAAEATSLLLPGGHELLAGATNLTRQGDGGRGGAEDRDELVDYSPGSAAEGLLARIEADEETPDRLTPVL
jgi:hypothetical protein